MPTKIKICGITSLREVEFLNESDVDFVGFVFAESKRKVSLNKARELSDALRKDIIRCGIFVNHSVDEINNIAEQARLDIAQVHKNYTEEMIKEINIPVWYAVSIKDDTSIAKANGAYRFGNVEGIVADSYVKGKEGGTGETFNWDILRGLDKDICLILAGGLNAGNIVQAIKQTKPYAVDISSGAEEIIGGKLQKTKDKVFRLIRMVKDYE